MNPDLTVYQIKRIIAVFFVMLLTSAYVAELQAQSFEEFREREQQALREFESAQEEGVAMEYEAWQIWRAAEQARFEDFRNEMMERWGSFRERTNRNWVEYSENGNVRWDVDFDSGDITLELLLDDDETDANDESVRERISQTLIGLAESRGTSTELPDDEQPVLDRPVLEGQLDMAGAADVEQFSLNTAQRAEVIQPEEDSESGARIVRVNLKLVPDHLRIRADAYREAITQQAERYDLDPALLLAVIHTESYFNPMARSHANALGLMQVVPETAGRDVYRALNQRDGVPEAEFLFDPDNNVLFGATYLDILRNRYIRGVSSSLTHDFMVIAAYNTGAGNVARAYTGHTNVARAVEQANAMSEEENMDFLVQNLPYAETRDYLRKVTERRSSYADWLSGSE